MWKIANVQNYRDRNVAHKKQRQRFSKRLQVTSKLVIPFVRDDINSTHPNRPGAIGGRPVAGLFLLSSYSRGKRGSEYN